MKKIGEEGGLSSLASKYFDNVDVQDIHAFSASHGIMTSIDGKYDDSGALIVDVTNVPPDFDDPDAVKSAMDARKRWTQFLDEATGYNSKQRGRQSQGMGKKSLKGSFWNILGPTLHGNGNKLV